MGRICVVTQDPGLGGGVLRKLIEFLEYAESRDHVCDVFFPSTESGDCPQRRRVASHPAVEDLVPVRVWKVPHFARADTFGWLCELGQEYDAYQLLCGSLYLGLPLVRADVTFVAWIAGTHEADVEGTGRTSWKHYVLYNTVTNYLTRRREARVGRAADRVIVDSSHSAMDVHDRLGVPTERIEVAPAPVDVDKYRPAQEPPDGPPYVLSVGRLDRRKDFRTLIRAFEKVLEETEAPSLELRIVGKGPEEASLRKYVQARGLAGKVRFLGFVEEEELIRQYRGATVFSLTSRQEGIGIVFLEALACGVPIVATDSGGSRDPVVDGETGYLSPVEDWESLAADIVRLVSDSQLRSELGEAGRDLAERAFSRDAVYTKFDDAYAEFFPSMHS